MDILPSRDIQMEKLPICRGCRRREATNPPRHQVGALTHGTPVTTSDPLRHHSLRVRSSMPHYNSKGELIKYSNTQVRRSYYKIYGAFGYDVSLGLAFRKTFATILFALHLPSGW
jgi:hypothetical protein